MGFGTKNIQSGLKATYPTARDSNFQPPFHTDDGNKFATGIVSGIKRIRERNKTKVINNEVDAPMPDYFPGDKTGRGNSGNV